jgi:hypothetical protein
VATWKLIPHEQDTFWTDAQSEAETFDVNSGKSVFECVKIPARWSGSKVRIEHESGG